MLKRPQASSKSGQIRPNTARSGKPLSMFFAAGGLIEAEDVSAAFGMSKSQLAQTMGVKPETLQRAVRSNAPRTQNRLREMLEIVSRVTEWAGGQAQAMAWYRAEPISAFGGRTAEALVKEGRAGAVRDWLDHIARGGFA